MEMKILEHGFMPIRQTLGSAGFDIFASADGELLPEDGKRICFVNTGIKLKLDENKMPEVPFRIHGRSGLAAKFGLDVKGGVHDSGEIFLEMHLYGNKPLSWKRQERIAQLILLDKYDAKLKK